MAKDSLQLVRYMGLRLEPAWRRLAAEELIVQKVELGRARARTDRA